MTELSIINSYSLRPKTKHTTKLIPILQVLIRDNSGYYTKTVIDSVLQEFLSFVIILYHYLLLLSSLFYVNIMLYVMKYPRVTLPLMCRPMWEGKMRSFSKTVEAKCPEKTEPGSNISTQKEIMF